MRDASSIHPDLKLRFATYGRLLVTVAMLRECDDNLKFDILRPRVRVLLKQTESLTEAMCLDFIHDGFSVTEIMDLTGII